MRVTLRLGLVTMLLLCGMSLPVVAAGAKTRRVTAQAPETPERWNAQLNVPCFDPRLGTLRSVTLRLEGRVTGTAKFENLGPAPLTLIQTLGVLFELRRPDGSTLLHGLPLVRSTETVAPFDGVTDFGGASGRTRSNLTATGTMELTLSNPADLRLFTGGATVGLALLARPQAAGVGIGEFSQGFSTRSRADLAVVFTYEAAPVAVESTSWSAIKSLYR